MPPLGNIFDTAIIHAITSGVILTFRNVLRRVKQNRDCIRSLHFAMPQENGTVPFFTGLFYIMVIFRVYLSDLSESGLD